MRKVKIKLCDFLNICDYKVLIYDENNHLLKSIRINNDNYIPLEITYYGIYKIVIISKHLYLKKRCFVLYLDRKTPDTLLIPYQVRQKKTRKIEFNLTDEIYKDLPIQKGEIILWEKNM